jgi:hypothetical protein
MYHNKDIDRLFQEKFKDFEKQPNASVWNDIEKKLSNKTRNKRTFIWFRLASIAAVLLLLFVVGSQFFNQHTTPTIEKVDTEISNPIVIESSRSTNKNDIVVSDELRNQLDQKQTKNKYDLVANSSKKEAKNTKNKEIKKITNSKQGYISNQTNKYNTIVTASKNNFDSEKITSNKTNNTKNLSEKTVSSLAINDIELDKTKSNTNLDKVEKTDHKETSIALSTNKSSLKKEKDNKKVENKIDINDAFAKNDIDDNLKMKSKKWIVGSSFTPIFYGSLSSGSSIDASIASNNKSSNTSYSYGANVSYKINNKWSVRTGIHNLDLSYSTDDVFYGEQVVAETSFQAQDANVRSSNNNVKVVIVPSNDRDLPDVSEFNRSAIGELEQNSSYIEIPLEVKYNLIDNKFGVQLIGGISTLFLNNNEVFLNDNDEKFVVGEATNLNKVNYSSNLGIDLNYHISKKWLVNVSPTFKYQFNAFSNNDGGFKPYVLGVYTGLNFKY